MTDLNSAAKAAAVLVKSQGVSSKAAADVVTTLHADHVEALVRAYDTNNSRLVCMVLDEVATAKQLVEMVAAREALMQADVANS